MKTLATMSALAVAGLVGLAACEHNDDHHAASAYSARPTGDQVGTTNAQGRDDSAVADQLSGARCDREQACTNIGDGQKYASRQVCMEQMRGSISNDLNTYNCPRGLDRNEIDHCMAAIRNEECNHPLDTLQRMTKCRADAICLK